MKKAKIISAFPGCGKSYCFKQNKNLTILDSDSSEFSWVKDDDGKNTKERNPEFPSNYIKHIKDNANKADVIFVSSHDNVRKALQDNGIEYTLVYPLKALKEEWKQRFIDRGNDEKFIEFIMNNWEDFITNCRKESYPTKLPLTKGEYISDVLDSILSE